mmetsp:Transcript_17229/g.26652  ORF Transcript_17229/g.26652 Transcript_17229/m.26652 type:complete len:115 (+) Transcript_17229:214-558(+)
MDQLRCSKCTKPCGAKVESTIKLSTCPHKAFGNDAGVLTCEDVPHGAYLRTCRNCRKEDGHLVCSCDNQVGQPSATSLPLSECEAFANSDGKLICDPDFTGSTGAPSTPKTEEL